MAHERDLEYLQSGLGRAGADVSAQPKWEDEEAHEEETIGSAVVAHETLVLAGMREILETGHAPDELFALLPPEPFRALEALQAARNGSATVLDRAEFGYVSALERSRLLNNALAELQPLLAAAECSHSEAIASELDRVRELVRETRHDIEQRILLETAKGKVKTRDMNEDDGEDEDPGAADAGESTL